MKIFYPLQSPQTFCQAPIRYVPRIPARHVFCHVVPVDLAHPRWFNIIIIQGYTYTQDTRPVQIFLKRNKNEKTIKTDFSNWLTKLVYYYGRGAVNLKISRHLQKIQYRIRTTASHTCPRRCMQEVSLKLWNTIIKFGTKLKFYNECNCGEILSLNYNHFSYVTNYLRGIWKNTFALIAKTIIMLIF